MNRTITVKGTGDLRLKPDMTVVSLTLKSLDKDYEKSMACSAAQLAQLRAALAAVGFDAQALKTENFSVCTEHESVQDETGRYKTVFSGYACIHALKLEFDFDTALLSKVLCAVSGCVADPDLNIRFTVRDPAAVSEALLRAAAENARAKAEVLCAASGVKLGELCSIDYNWGELNVYSNTGYMMEKRCMTADCAIDITPDDIRVSDSAAFVWEILPA